MTKVNYSCLLITLGLVHIKCTWCTCHVHDYCITVYYCIIIIIVIKKDWQCKAGRGRLTPYQSEDPSPTLPAYSGKEDKGKIVEDY